MGGGSTLLRIRAACVESIEMHARETYPEECCGFLIGPSKTRPRRIVTARRARNVAPSDRERRYTIEPIEILTVEKSLRGSSNGILGFYHSHPDHPAAPSAYDRERASWPGYSYLILSIRKREPAALTAWKLVRQAGPFVPDRLTIEG